VSRAQAAATQRRGQGENPDMVTIQVQNLIDFVAEVFAHSESSPEEARRIATYLTTANLTGHDSHGVIRVPVYIRWKKMGSVVPDQTVELWSIRRRWRWSMASSATGRP
jgi:LDH2 family malate/lactate/ureidoglycolate dehydrogenase